MELWRTMAIEELEKLIEALDDEDFTPSDLRDRLRAQLEFAELMPGEPLNEGSD